MARIRLFFDKDMTDAEIVAAIKAAASAQGDVSPEMPGSVGQPGGDEAEVEQLVVDGGDLVLDDGDGG